MSAKTYIEMTPRERHLDAVAGAITGWWPKIPQAEADAVAEAAMTAWETFAPEPREITSRRWVVKQAIREVVAYAPRVLDDIFDVLERSVRVEGV